MSESAWAVAAPAAPSAMSRRERRSEGPETGPVPRGRAQDDEREEHAADDQRLPAQGQASEEDVEEARHGASYADGRPRLAQSAARTKIGVPVATRATNHQARPTVESASTR